jgi:hypothetical protein
MNMTFERALWASTPALRCLAPLDALLAPALGLWRAGRMRAAAGWILGCGAAAALFALSLALNPADAERLRTIERLTGDSAGLEARVGLWAAALDWAGRAAPFGLGTGGFTIAAGHGERRGLYPHNHALEALAEGGLPGLILWLGASRATSDGPAPPIPWFVVGFAAMILLNSVLDPPLWVRQQAQVVTVFLLTMSLAALGLETDLRRLRLKGPRPLVLGALAWLFITGVTLAGLMLIR